MGRRRACSRGGGTEKRSAWVPAAHVQPRGSRRCRRGWHSPAAVHTPPNCPALQPPADLIFSEDGTESKNEKGDTGLSVQGNPHSNFNSGEGGVGWLACLAPLP